MMPPVGCHDVVSRLRAAVVTNDHSGTGVTDEKVGEQPLAGITESEVDDHERAHVAFYQPLKRRRIPRAGGTFAAMPAGSLATFIESLSGDSVRMTGFRRS